MSLLSEIRVALRQFRKAPIFTLTILAVLALGVGATTSIFGLFDQVLLRVLPVSQPERLVRVRGHSNYFNGSLQMVGGDPDEYMSYPAYQYLRDHSGHIFSGVLASAPEQNVGVQWQGETRLASTELVSGNYFQVLGVAPAAGRAIEPSDTAVQLGSPVAMLSYRYWQTRFGGDPRVVGSAIRINGHLFTIVGVAPARFHSVSAGEVPDIFAPMTMKPVITPERNALNDYTAVWLNVVGRLAPGMTLQQAQAAMQPVWHAERQIDFTFQQQQTPAIHKRFVDQARLMLLDGATGFSPLRDALETPLKALVGMAALVLLMACANVAGLLLVRAAGRAKEISVRYALGAKRSRIVMQLLLEGLVLGTAGGAFGLLLAQPVSRLMVRLLENANSGEMFFAPTLDMRLILIAVGITLATSVLFSLAPALQFWRPDLTPAMKQQNTTASGSALTLRRIAVAAQISLSVLLLAGAGLFVRTVHSLRAEDLGFRPDHLISFGVDPQLAGYQAEQVGVLDARILAMLRSLPGVKAVSATDDPEMMGSGEDSVASLKVPGYKEAHRGDHNVEWSSVMPGYLETIGLPVIAGRGITDADRKGSMPVAVLSRNAANLYYGDAGKALGRTFSTNNIVYTIVGIAEDSHHDAPTGKLPRRVFVAYLQGTPGYLAFVVRTAATPAPMLETVRRAMHNLDANLALDSPATMEAQIGNSMAQSTALALLATAFGILAALLSAIGLYGVLAFDVVQRTREIGVRMALGASRRAVARLLLAETLRLAGWSIALALPLAWGLAHLVRSLLYGVTLADPLVYLAAALLVGLTATAAATIPAWRAASIEPLHALRYE